MDTNKNQLPRRNPLDVASLTTPLSQSHEASFGSSSGGGGSSSSSSSSSSIRPSSNLESKEPISKSAPFTCASVEETLRRYARTLLQLF